MKKNLLIISMLFLLVSFCVNAENKKVKNIYLEQVEGKTITKKSYLQITNNLPLKSYESDEQNSDIPNLKAKVESGSDENTSCISIMWDKKIKKIYLKSQVNAIYWRPKSSSFIYSITEQPQPEEEYGATALFYVILKNTSNGIQLNTQRLKSEPDTFDLCWSKDGSYYAYVIYSGIGIKEFSSGKTWLTKKISIDNGKKIFTADTPKEFGSLYWFDNDKKIVFWWRDESLQDEPAGYALIDINQFKINKAKPLVKDGFEPRL